MAEKSVAEKLWIRPGDRVLIVEAPEEYAEILGELPAGAELVGATSPGLDFIQVFVQSRQELEDLLPDLGANLDAKGKLWVTYPKGTSGFKVDINRDSIAAYARSIGLQAVAMISVDKVWSALRLKKA